MINQNIGYIICETASSEPRDPVIISDKNDRVTIEAVLQDMNVKNRNGRFYSDKELMPELTSSRTTELIRTGNFCGEAGHPMSKDISRQQTIDPNNVSHKILKLWREGDNIKAHVRGTPNDKGENFNNFILDDTKVSFSLRALGSVQNTARGAEVKNIRVITWDWVIFPSHKAAYMQKIVDESANLYSQKEGSQLYIKNDDAGIIEPITNKQVMDYIKTESANIKTVLNSFDTLYESASLVDNGRRVQLVSNQGDILNINLETYIRNEVLDYCNK